MSSRQVIWALKQYSSRSDWEGNSSSHNHILAVSTDKQELVDRYNAMIDLEHKRNYNDQDRIKKIPPKLKMDEKGNVSSSYPGNTGGGYACASHRICIEPFHAWDEGHDKQIMVGDTVKIYGIISYSGVKGTVTEVKGSTVRAFVPFRECSDYERKELNWEDKTVLMNFDKQVYWDRRENVWMCTLSSEDKARRVRKAKSIKSE